MVSNDHQNQIETSCDVRGIIAWNGCIAYIRRRYYEIIAMEYVFNFMVEYNIFIEHLSRYTFASTKYIRSQVT